MRTHFYVHQRAIADRALPVVCLFVWAQNDHRSLRALKPQSSSCPCCLYLGLCAIAPDLGIHVYRTCTSVNATPTRIVHDSGLLKREKKN